MRVLVVSRLYSGLAAGLQENRWVPAGVPAVCRLLEALAAAPDIELITVFTAKDHHGGWISRPRELDIEPIGKILLLPALSGKWLRMIRVEGIARELFQLIALLAIMLRFRPQVAYFTNANFISAGVTARLRLAPVVLRLLGLHPVQKRIADSAAGLQRWFYRSPFRQVVCSMDGSGGGLYLPRLLAPQVPYLVILNGVEPFSPNPAGRDAIRAKFRLDGRPTVLFLGRLEPNKGGSEFVEAVIAVLRTRGEDAINAVIVGDGSEASSLAARVEAAGLLHRIHFTGSVPRSAIYEHLEVADIYVSINFYGNLSNANLEALAAGRCMVILSSDPADGTDVETDELLPPEVAIRINRHRPTEALTEVLLRLLDAPETVAKYSAAARAAAARLLSTWDERTAVEIDLIRQSAVRGVQG